MKYRILLFFPLLISSIISLDVSAKQISKIETEKIYSFLKANGVYILGGIIIPTVFAYWIYLLSKMSPEERKKTLLYPEHDTTIDFIDPDNIKYRNYARSLFTIFVGIPLYMIFSSRDKQCIAKVDSVGIETKKETLKKI